MDLYQKLKGHSLAFLPKAIIKLDFLILMCMLVWQAFGLYIVYAYSNYLWFQELMFLTCFLYCRTLKACSPSSTDIPFYPFGSTMSSFPWQRSGRGCISPSQTLASVTSLSSVTGGQKSQQNSRSGRGVTGSSVSRRTAHLYHQQSVDSTKYYGNEGTWTVIMLTHPYLAWKGIVIFW